MEPRYVCPHCKSTFLDSRIKTNAQGFVECPVCGSTSFYSDESPEGLKLLADTIAYESSAYDVYLAVERDLDFLYHVAPGRDWDGVLAYFKNNFQTDASKSVTYKVGFNHAENVRLILVIGKWEVTLAVNSENRVYVHSMYRNAYRKF